MRFSNASRSSGETSGRKTSSSWSTSKNRLGSDRRRPPVDDIVGPVEHTLGDIAERVQNGLPALLAGVNEPLMEMLAQPGGRMLAVHVDIGRKADLLRQSRRAHCSLNLKAAASAAPRGRKRVRGAVCVRGRNSVRYQLPIRPSIRRLVFRKGSRPARSSDDFPDPEPPSTATTRFLARRLRTASTLRSRPKKISPSPGSKERRPG